MQAITKKTPHPLYGDQVNRGNHLTQLKDWIMFILLNWKRWNSIQYQSYITPPPTQFYNWCCPRYLWYISKNYATKYMVCILDRILFSPTHLENSKQDLQYISQGFISWERTYSRKKSKKTPDTWIIFLLFLTAILIQVINISTCACVRSYLVVWYWDDSFTYIAS